MLKFFTMLMEIKQYSSSLKKFHIKLNIQILIFQK